MRRFFKNFGWICLGIFLQFKFNVLYGIVFLENLNFHDRTYYVKMEMVPTEEKLRLLKVEATVHHSLGPDYFANVYIPEKFEILNQKPYLAAEPIPGYKAYQMNMKRKYRDVLSKKDWLILASQPEDIEPTAVIVRFENLKQLLHKDQTYKLSSTQEKAVLEGPEIVEAKYSQKLGM